MKHHHPVAHKHNKIWPIKNDRVESFTLRNMAPEGTLSPRHIVQIDGGSRLQPIHSQEYPDLRQFKQTIKGLAQARRKIKKIDALSHRLSYTACPNPLLQVVEAANCKADTRIQQRIKSYYTKMVDDYLHSPTQRPTTNSPVKSQSQHPPEKPPVENYGPKALKTVFKANSTIARNTLANKELFSRTISVFGQKTPKALRVGSLEPGKSQLPPTRSKEATPTRHTLRRKVEYDQIDEYIRTISIDLKPVSTAGLFRRNKDYLVFNHFEPVESSESSIIQGYSLPSPVKKRSSKLQLDEKLEMQEQESPKETARGKKTAATHKVVLPQFKIQGWVKRQDQEQLASY